MPDQVPSDPRSAERGAHVKVAEIAPTATGGAARTGHPGVFGQTHHSDSEIPGTGGPDRSAIVVEPGRDRCDERTIGPPRPDAGIGLTCPFPAELGHACPAVTAQYPDSAAIGHLTRVTDGSVGRAARHRSWWSPAFVTGSNTQRAFRSSTRMVSASAPLVDRAADRWSSVPSVVSELSVGDDRHAADTRNRREAWKH